MTGAEVIAGKYELIRPLGQGGMAEVFLARQQGVARFEKLVVVKRILPGVADDEAFVTLFLDEARTAADLRHQNVVTIFEIGEERGTHHIVMEYIHGQDLRRIVRKCARAETALPISSVVQVGIDVASGLHHAHEKTTLDGLPLGIVHRDISPQNVIVSYEGTAKVVDFGIAKAATKDFVTRTGAVMGKYAYMSPEQLLAGDVDAKTDQFALGIVLWELLTMRRLFKRKGDHQTMMAVAAADVPPPSEVADVPKALDAIVLRALQKERGDRYPTCQALVHDLEDFLAAHRVPYSPSRFGLYLQDLFADERAEEERVGVGQAERSALSASLPAEGARAVLPGEEDATQLDKPREGR